MKKEGINISDQVRFFEISAAVITGLGKLLFFDVLNMHLVYIILACTFWISYLIYKNNQNKGILKYWGFTRSNFKHSFLKLLPYAIVSVIAFIVYGWVYDTLILNWHILIILLVYPLWGVIQQFLVVGLVAGNLNDQNKIPISKPLIILITACLFSIIHYPFTLLIFATFILAIVYSIEYLKERNLWVLGIYHGWLGCFFYYFVLNRDPFNEVFGMIQ